MQISALLTSLLAAVAAAAPAKSCPAPERVFGIMSLRSASPLHYGTVTAAQNKLWIGLPESRADAVCERPHSHDSVRTSAFVLRDGELFLYGPKGGPVQQFFVDRSGMGQGNLSYFTKGTQSPPRNAELKGWKLSEDNFITFDGSDFLACPRGKDGKDGWVVWIENGIEKPAGQEGCLAWWGLSITTEDASRCTYSTAS